MEMETEMKTVSKAGHTAIKCARTTYAYESMCVCVRVC